LSFDADPRPRGTPLSIRRTKIVATLGPATSSLEQVASLVAAGLDVARINASHGAPEQHAALIAATRAAAAAAGKPVAVLLDLQGPRIRIGELAAAVALEPGRSVVFAPEGAAGPGEIPTTYDLAADVTPGTRILIADGTMALDVVAVRPPRVEARVSVGGQLTSRKGINLPGVAVSAPALTDKDRTDVAFAVEHGVEYVALSFVRRAEDVSALRALLPPGIRIVAKIEKDTALGDLERIADASDGVMVARGDLGVELPYELVPLAQKRVIRVAVEHRRPVITATQMLESMVRSPRPTRAEASDVANAILDGTDAVMLSEETAIGAYPREAVEAMDRIIRAVEGDHGWRAAPEWLDLAPEAPARSEHAVAAAAVAAARMLGAPIIVTFTKSGFSARMVAANRPAVPILAVTDTQLTYRQLALVWGVVPMLVEGPPHYDAMLDAARGRILAQALAKKGDRVVVTAGVPFDVPGTTNLVKVEEV
jgi:pyruvate kinase